MVPGASTAKLKTAALSLGFILAACQLCPLSSESKMPADVPATRRPFFAITKALAVSSLSLRATGVHCVPRVSAIFSVWDGRELLSALLQKTMVVERHRKVRQTKDVFKIVI